METKTSKKELKICRKRARVQGDDETYRVSSASPRKARISEVQRNARGKQRPHASETSTRLARDEEEGSSG
jgi:hypothetical protein